MPAAVKSCGHRVILSLFEFSGDSVAAIPPLELLDRIGHMSAMNRCSSSSAPPSTPVAAPFEFHALWRKRLMGRRILLAILTLFVAGTAARAQTDGRVVGRVSTVDGRSLPGIQITVSGSTRDGDDRHRRSLCGRRHPRRRSQRAGPRHWLRLRDVVGDGRVGTSRLGDVHIVRDRRATQSRRRRRLRHGRPPSDHGLGEHRRRRADERHSDVRSDEGAAGPSGRRRHRGVEQ